jgi:hypothetical protein
MKLLPKDEIEIQSGNKDIIVIAAIHEHPEGYLYWGKYKLSGLLHYLISGDDSECIDVDDVHEKPLSSN